MNKYIITIFLFFGGTTILFSQRTKAEKNLIERVQKNYTIVYSNPEIAFLEAKKIEKEAQKIDAKREELQAINMQCLYYGASKDFDKMLKTGKILYQKSEKYKMRVYQVMARRHTFEAYIFTDLPDKAFEELEQASKIINKLDENDPLVIDEKIRLFSSYGNYYWSKGDVETQLKYAFRAVEQIKKILEGKRREKELYFYYCNIAGSYAELKKMDSAKIYAELSLSKNKEEYKRNDVQALNFWTLGKVAEYKKEYKKALLFLKKAEKLEGYKNHRNIELIYNDIVNLYTQLQQEDSAKMYQTKKDSLKLVISEEQKKSLTTLLNEKKEDRPTYIYLLLSFVGIMMGLTFVVIRKNRTLSRQEKTSNIYIEKELFFPSGDDYSKLIKALQENDPAFMFYFQENFPHFSSKLLKINPKLSALDVEFCALLKLKIPTKDIARYKFIAPKTVLNKKYVVANKLKIPKSTDIYEWLDNI